MASLATALAAVPHGPSDVGDIIWRNTDIAGAEWIGICPSEQLFDELLMTVGAGENGTCLAKLVPSRALLERAITTGSASVRRGAVANPHTTDDDLAALSADKAVTVAQAAKDELAERSRLRAEIANGSREALIALIHSVRLQLISEIIDTEPEAAGSISPGDQGELLVKLEALDSQLRDRFALSVIVNERAHLTATVVRWALNGSVAGETLLAAMGERQLRLRATDVAVGVLTQAGLLAPAKQQQTTTSAATLEGMALVLTPGELAAMYFSSTAPISETLEDTILAECPAQLLASYLLGAVRRQPTPEMVRKAIMGVDTERRSELCLALSAAIKDPEQVIGLPWAGELALGMTTTGLRRLGMSAAGELFCTLDEMLNHRAEGWEFLLVLAEEWERTLADLAIAAGVIEDVHDDAHVAY
jgi:hypothetical protein